MTTPLDRTLAAYVESYNSRDVNATLACFSETAVVHDEGHEHRGRKAIGDWLRATLEKYQPVLSAGEAEETKQETVLAMTVSGSFPGSPVRLGFHFVLAGGKIAALDIAP